MPLKCLYADDQPVLSSELSREDFETLRLEHEMRQHLHFACCEARVGLRVSKGGIQHFYHLGSHATCRSEGETEVHLQLKFAAMTAARNAGWAAECEVAGGDGLERSQARGSVRIAMEAQLSNLSWEEISRRQERYRIDLRRLVAVGHSAGADLALWAAGRARIASTSPLFAEAPLRIPTVISLGGLPDLRNDAATIGRSCGLDVTTLIGKPNAARPDPFADTSPASMLPDGLNTVGINGAQDTIAPPEIASEYAALARKAGDQARTAVVDIHSKAYGVQRSFSDGHAQGIFPWPFLEALGD